MTATNQQLRRQKYRVLGIGAILTGLIASSCSSAGSAAKETGATPASHLKGTPIVVATIADSAVPGGGNFGEVVQGVAARVNEINAAGGVNGRPLKLNTCNSGGNPNMARTCAQQVASSGAVAVLGLTSAADSSAMPVLQQAGIPVIGLFPFDPAAAGDPDAFCFNGGVAASFFGLAGTLHEAGATKVSLIYPSDVGADSAAALGGFQASVKSQPGLQDMGSAGYSYANPQFAPAVAKALGTGANGVAVSAANNAIVLLIQTVRQQSSTVKVAAVGIGLTPSVIATMGSAATGIYADYLGQPPSATSVPGIKLFEADMQKYEPTAAADAVSINGWVSAYALQTVLTGLSTITPASVLAAMAKATNLSTGGIYPAVSASSRANKYYGEGCLMTPVVVAAKIQNGQLVATNPGQFINPLS